MNSRLRVMTALNRGQPDRVPWIEHSVAAPIQAAIMGRKPEDVDPFEFAQTIGLDAVAFMGLQPVASSRAETSEGDSRYSGGRLSSRSDWEAWVETWPDPNSGQLYEGLDNFIEKGRRTDLALCYVSAHATDPLLYSWGIDRYALLTADDLAFVREMMDRITDWCVLFHQQLCRRDLDFLWVCHDLAHKHGTFFSSEYLRREDFPRERRVASEITLPWMYHSCGDFSSVAEDMIAQGCNAIEPFQPEAIDIWAFKKQYGHRVCVKGNVCMDVLMFRDREAVEREVREKIAQLAPGGGYICSSAHSIYGACKPENVVHMGEAIRQYGTYPIKVQAATESGCQPDERQRHEEGR